jgi:hypothetical protein
MSSASPTPAGQPAGTPAARGIRRARQAAPRRTVGLGAAATAAIGLATVAAALPASPASAASASPASAASAGPVVARAAAAAHGLHPAAVSALKNFPVGKAGAWPVTATIAANGTAYLAYTAYTTKAEGFAAAWVCVLPRGARKCSATTLLKPLDSATSVDNQPDSIVLGPGGTVEVLVTTTNDANSDDITTGGLDADTLEYVLSASGKLTSVTRVGTLDQQGTALRFDGQLLWTSGGDDTSGGGAEIQETPADGTFKNIAAPVALDLAGTPAAGELDFDGTSAVPLPDGDLLLAWDDGTNAYAVEVNVADGDEVVRSAEFKTEVTTDNFGGPAGSLVTGRAGTFLLTRASNDGFGGRMEVHQYAGGSGSLFAAARKIPTTTADFGDFKINEDGQGKLSVYYERDDVLVQETSTDGGKKWSVYDYASPTPVVTPNITPALTAFGAGVVFEAAGGTVSDGILPRVQPVWVHQSVSFGLKKSRIGHGASTTGSGKVVYPHSGQEVTLQRGTSHGWVTVTTGHTSASGAYSFTIHAGATGTTKYRVVAAEVTGWFFSDDSGVRALDVT